MQVVYKYSKLYCNPCIKKHYHNLTQRRLLFLHQWKSFKRWQDLRKENKEYKAEKAAIENSFRLNDNLYISPETVKQAKPVKKPIEEQTRRESGALSIEYLTNHTQFRYLDHSFDNIRRVRAYKRLQHLQYDQRFDPERLMFLGPDLAAAHFIVHRYGAVKFLNDNTWYRRKRSFFSKYNLPTEKVLGLYIEAIDASNTELIFEGFDNLYDLNHIRFLSVANCKKINDWTLSRIGGMFSKSLEFLDLSHCNRISAKGLVGLKSLKKLRFLRLEGLEKITNLAKSALLLEETIPGLTVIGVDYDKAFKKLEEENRLMQNDRILIDAKGNAFVEDDNGRLFYVHGNVNERPTVCDDDKPIVTSTIRREIPSMSDAEFELLDNLSQGKLRHFLLGSPSGYSWNKLVETILLFEAKWKKWEGIPIDPKMLPKIERQKKLEGPNGENKFFLHKFSNIKLQDTKEKLFDEQMFELEENRKKTDNLLIKNA